MLRADRLPDLTPGLHIVIHNKNTTFSVIRLYHRYCSSDTFMVDYEELARCTTLEAAQSARRLLSHE